MELLIKAWTKIGQRWPIVIGCLAVALLAAVAYEVSSDTEYTASTEFFLRAPDVKTSAGAYQGDLFSRQRAQTYVNLFQSDDLAQTVIDKLGLTLTPQQLVSKVSAVAVKNTVLMAVSVTDGNAQHAANIANGYGSVLNAYVAKLENVSNDPTVGPLIQVVAKATPATATASGYPLWMVMFGALMLALASAVGIIWFLERFDTKVRSRRQVEEITGCDIIGKLPKTPSLGPDGNVGRAFDECEEFEQGALRLSLNIESVLQRLPRIKAEIPPVVAIVAGHDGDGGTVATQALARAFADRGRRVGVVRLGEKNQQTPQPSLALAGAGPAEVDGAREPVTTVSCTTETLTAEIHDREARLLDNNVILVDAPSFHDSIDAQLALEAADAVVLVVRPIATTTLSLSHLVTGVRALDIPLLGVVVTQAKESATVDGAYL
ncbi:Wzz/FepE/Etk N-terminal domain-containing protein [Mycobacterium paraterrae]|uniref:Wzz/FepE/Etk N-terminal domain-containing protein n=1 Tax=Mycobacterium paraterrae TaxID=577492 RepID=A0ABY3VQK1_9MYCO|nr:Wzz/FepE/Etk N-terminal domain-containing protein [Mycobacterium paraterrae]UMB70718.1 Wzz/FepE/Etk N-terminal domain-containing protein [Mycobacterium paraterrae]